ncbi:MAG TPA: hypothetical protein VFV25_11095 [Methylibium sp.]
MKKLIACALFAAVAAPAMAADVGVSVSVSQPGLYGRIDIGNVPAPAVILPQPVIIAPSPVAVYQQPIYLHVPPGHEKHWEKHCAQYNACGQPVYFVQEGWYQREYAPRFRNGRGDEDGDRGRGRGHGDRGDHGRKHGHGHEDD